RCPSGREALRPDLILQIGAYPISRGYEELLRSAPIERFVLAPHGWPDPVGDAAEVVVADLGPTVAALLERLKPVHRDEAFLSRLEAADAALHGVIEKVLGEEPFGEAAVANVVVRSLPPGATLAVGNSLPVRELSLVCPGALGDVTVVSQRGVSGIDGLVAGAAGAASAAGAFAKPTLLYLGDVSFLHDVGGLMAARGIESPFVVVVSNNDGGRIFEQLPVATADLPRGALELFTTPHGLSFRPAAELYGHRYAEVTDAGALRAAVDRGLSRPGCTVIEAKIPQSSASRELDSLTRGAEEALASLLLSMEGLTS
ncbi:MAG: 2-succinyl-5-enolpyruvyl-6-hydroxy-3-cyclohexene-1-carboxylate synthase, partial [Deltaproteobacteria bacterium]